MTDTKLERQLALEVRANHLSYERMTANIQNTIRRGHADELLEGRLILLHSIDAVAAKIEEYFAADLRGKKAEARKMLMADFWDAPKDLAYIVVVTLIRNISQNAMLRTASLIRNLNNSVYESIVVRRLDNDGSTLGAFVDKRFAHRSLDFRTKEKKKIAQRQSALIEVNLDTFTTYVGGTLLDLVLKSGANIIEIKNVRSKKDKTMSYVVFTEECYAIVLGSRETMLQEYMKYPIFLTKPKPWTDFYGTGGYYREDLYSLTAIKPKVGSRKLLSGFFKRTDQSKLFDTLNTLQETAWRVNKRVFDIMYDVMENNLVDPEYPRHNPKLIGGLPYNGFLNPYDYVNIHDFGEVHTEGPHKGRLKDKDAIRQYHKAIEAQRDICTVNNGRMFFMNLTLHNALEYVDEERFYFSYQYDFRGRIYPIQQHLQPQGAGSSKALIEFADGYPIDTDEAYRWFMINGGNYYGYDKLPYDQRISKMESMKDDIMAIADDPMGNRRLWKDVEEPYLWLAWCFEYSDYLKDRDGFLSHLPVALDATCSGIQIYSGLLRDREGAKAVNVIGDTREDIYQMVADRVNGYLASGDYDKFFTYKDSAGTTHTESTEAIARSLKGKVTRSLVKSNVMTQPYSVTRLGMVEQLKSLLLDLENNNKRFWVGDIWLVAQFLANLNDRAITEVVKGARVGQEYLKDITRAVVKNGDWIFYTVPITGFPVLQKIHLTKVDRISTPVGKLSINTPLEGIHMKKMQNGIAPNYVHSLDAALLAITVNKLKDDGCKDFHMIHDSYGVPVSFVERLNKNVREAYVELFSQDPLERFVSQVKDDHDTQPKDVMINTLDLEEVKEAKYIFS